MINNIIKETTRIFCLNKGTAAIAILYTQNFWSPYWASSTCSTFGKARITFSPRNPQALYPNFVAFRGVSSCLYIPMPTRLSYSRFTHAQIEAGSPFGPKKEDIRAWKDTSIRRVNAINESARITCPATRSRFSAFSFISPLLSGHPPDLRCICPSRPTVRVFSAREAESVAINSPLALTVDAGHDIRNVARIQCFRALDGNRRFHPCRVDESVARRNQFRAQIPYLRARRNRRFELIVDEPSRALFLPFSLLTFLFSFPQFVYASLSGLRSTCVIIDVCRGMKLFR